MTNDPERRAGLLRRRLADELERSGALRSPQWRTAVERVPRHEFLPEFFQRVDTPDRGTCWEPVDNRRTGPWLDLAYRNETWVTQLDGVTAPCDVTGPVTGDPTSSSTLPSLVVRMLEDLDVADDMSVLEIGTGTGYSTALMCERLGEDRVTSIEVDANVAAAAAAALGRAGCSPHLVAGDGLSGAPARAPHDRIIATCSVRTVPPAWLAQARPGARILATVTGWLHGYGLARLNVADGVAEGRFLPGTVSFMIARPQAPPPIDAVQWEKLTAPLAAAEPRPAVVGGDIRHDWTGVFVAQLAAPTVQWQARRTDGGPWIDYFADLLTGSCAALTPGHDGGWTVRQSGPTRIWDNVENAIAVWRSAGSPDIDRFRIRTDGHTQTTWLDTVDRRAVWTQSP